LTQFITIIIIIIMTNSPSRAVRGKPAATSGSNPTVPRHRSDLFKVGEDGIPLPRYAPPLARRLQQICASLHAEALTGSGIVMLEFAMLRFAAEFPGIEQWRWADAIGIDRNSASLIGEALERGGLIDRRVNDADRRTRELYLTPKGYSTFKEYLPKVQMANKRTLAPLSAREQTVFFDLFVKLIEGNSAYARPGAGRRKRRSAKEKESS
jgi:DNA-binding MarR family transcriptional regulator